MGDDLTTHFSSKIKSMKKLLYTLSLAILGTLAHAQVKIGANPGTIGSSSNLEVESSNGTKVVVDKTTGNLGAGVTDPGQSIDAAGTARLRSVPNNTSNNQILTIDANGVIAKQNAQAAQLPTIYGVKSTVGVDLLADDTPHYTGTSITLPANSRYLVQATMLLRSDNYAPITTTPSAAFIRSFFSDAANSTATTADVINGNSLISGSIVSGQIYSLATGSIILNNTSASPKTYYYLAVMGSLSSNSSYNLPVGYRIYRFGGTTWAENSLYAIPLN